MKKIKNIFIALLSIIIAQVSQAQIKNYFIPSKQYIDQSFQFKSEIWENENGRFKSINNVKYSLDRSGNYKKYIEKTSYLYNVPEFKMKVHQFYYVGDDEITIIYSDIEGVSEKLEQKGYGSRKRKNTILKTPPSQWNDSSDLDAIEYYKSEFGKTTTDYGKYDNCIIVTKTFKAKTDNAKSINNLTFKYYYAYGIGLIKTENYQNGKLTKMEYGYGGTLVDNFSEYSFSFNNKRKQEKIAEKKKIQKEMKKKQNFIAAREETVYNLKDYDLAEYTLIKSKIENKILSVHQKNSANNYAIEFETILKTNIKSKTNNSVKILNTSNELDLYFSDILNDINISPKTKYGLTVNVKMSERYSVSRTSQKFIIKANENSIKLKKGNLVAYEQFSANIENDIKKSGNTSGTYSLVYSESSINEITSLDIKYTDFKGLGGAGNAFLSVLIPGLGNHFVNGGKGSILGKNASPWLTTVGTLALLSTGSGLVYSSQQNYKLYQQASVQKDIDKLYETANFQHKTGYTIIGLSAGIWITDIIWTALNGSKNKSKEKLTKEKLNIALYPSATSDNLAMTITFNIK